MTLPRGIRNKNPLNIRESEGDNTQWNGEAAIDTDAAFEVFTDAKYGYRAARRILKRYNERGIYTVEEIINEWAPPVENVVESYVSHVESLTGFPRYFAPQPDLHVAKLFQAMAIHENGAKWADHQDLSIDVIQQGVALA